MCKPYMEIYNNKSIRCVLHHAGVLLHGFAKMLPSLLNAALLVSGTIGLRLVAEHRGYIAVLEFLMAVLCFVAALTHAYLMGDDKKVTKK